MSCGNVVITPNAVSCLGPLHQFFETYPDMGLQRYKLWFNTKLGRNKNAVVFITDPCPSQEPGHRRILSASKVLLQ